MKWNKSFSDYLDLKEIKGQNGDQPFNHMASFRSAKNHFKDEIVWWKAILKPKMKQKNFAWELKIMENNTQIPTGNTKYI